MVQVRRAVGTYDAVAAASRAFASSTSRCIALIWPLNRNARTVTAMTAAPPRAMAKGVLVNWGDEARLQRPEGGEAPHHASEAHHAPAVLRRDQQVQQRVGGRLEHRVEPAARRGHGEGEPVPLHDPVDAEQHHGQAEQPRPAAEHERPALVLSVRSGEEDADESSDAARGLQQAEALGAQSQHVRRVGGQQPLIGEPEVADGEAHHEQQKEDAMPRKRTSGRPRCRAAWSCRSRARIPSGNLMVTMAMAMAANPAAIR